jgi:hypothetical protein
MTASTRLRLEPLVDAEPRSLITRLGALYVEACLEIRGSIHKKVGCSPREGECLDIPHPEREIPTGKSQSENLLAG